MLTFAQSPKTISYQAILRDNIGVLISNDADVSVRVSLIQGNLIDNNVIYSEHHDVATNANGLFTIEIGGGTILTGNFGNINWANGPFFIKTETAPSGGTNYSITGTTQLLSVPYALYAKKTGDTGNVLLISGSSSAIGQSYQTLFEADVKANKVVNLEGFISTTGSEVTVYIFDVTNSQWITSAECIYEETNVGFRYFNGSTGGARLPFSANNKKFNAKFIPLNDSKIEIKVKELTATSANGVGSATVILSQ